MPHHRMRRHGRFVIARRQCHYFPVFAVVFEDWVNSKLLPVIYTQVISLAQVR